MPLHFFKPVVWNDQGYQRPGGGKFTSGFPEENGFGVEEWNNAARLEYVESGLKGLLRHALGVVRGDEPDCPGKRNLLTALIGLQRAADRRGNRGTRFRALVL